MFRMIFLHVAWNIDPMLQWEFFVCNMCSAASIRNVSLLSGKVVWEISYPHPMDDLTPSNGAQVSVASARNGRYGAYCSAKRIPMHLEDQLSHS
jgi:hypothetical protein